MHTLILKKIKKIFENKKAAYSKLGISGYMYRFTLYNFNLK